MGAIEDSPPPISLGEARLASKALRLCAVAAIAAVVGCSSATSSGAPGGSSSSATAPPPATTPPPTPLPTPSAPLPTSGPGTITLEPLDPGAFAFGTVAPKGTDGLAARTVAATMYGWLAGGGYSRASDGVAEADAAAWFSPDGITWERLESEDLGGPGYQAMYDILGHPATWAVGSSQVRAADATSPVLWRMGEQLAWERVDARCNEGLACGDAIPEVQALALAEFDDLSGKGWLLGAGIAGSRFAALRIELDGRITAVTPLPIPKWSAEPQATIASSMSRGPEGEWVIAATSPITGDVGPVPMPVAWHSADGSTWRLLSAGSVEALREAHARRIDGTPSGWFALGERLLWSTDLVSWAELSGPAGVEWWNNLAQHRDMLFAFVDGPDGLLVSSDGSTWNPVAVPGGGLPLNGASDGETMILVGSRFPDAAAWRVVFPE